MAKEDPGIQWVRDVRHKISEEFDHDPRKLIEHYIEMQKQYEDRLVRMPKSTPEQGEELHESPEPIIPVNA
jgi:hypothetical protein